MFTILNSHILHVQFFQNLSTIVDPIFFIARYSTIFASDPRDANPCQAGPAHMWGPPHWLGDSISRFVKEPGWLPLRLSKKPIRPACQFTPN